MDDKEYFRHVTLLTAQLAPSFGKCGCIIVDDMTNTIASTGYNFQVVPEPKEDGSHICHAEDSAISSCNFRKNYFYTMYVSLSPCMNCAEKILKEPRIRKVYYGVVHPDPKYGCVDALIHLKQNGVEVECW